MAAMFQDKSNLIKKQMWTRLYRPTFAIKRVLVRKVYTTHKPTIKFISCPNKKKLVWRIESPAARS